MLLLTLLLACGEVGPPDIPADGPAPAEAVQAVRLELHEAHQAWSEGRHAEARARVHSAYARWFEPLEPALRARDADGTLAVEVAFGRLGARVGRRGDALTVAQEVQGVTREMDALVQLLPQPEAAPAAPAAGAPQAEEVALPAHLVGGG
jgi:hypothetical protein